MYTIKPMQTEPEIDGKAYVHYKSWHETYHGLIDESYLQDRMTLDFCMRAAHRWPDNLWVAKDGETVVGFMGCGPYRDDTLPEHGEVFGIYVLEAYHGQKVGYALMNTALDQLADYDRIALWVLKGNEKAIRFYERYGFRFDGAEKDVMLGTPNTELRMIYQR